MQNQTTLEYQQYTKCIQLKFTGGHKAGLASCPFCAQIYRRYHPQVQTSNAQQVCECCNGNSQNCQTPQCIDMGFCIPCDYQKDAN